MSLEISLFNTLSRSVEPFNPIVPGKVGLYCCGPTVYNFQHIGNMKTYIFEDVLVRTLRTFGYNVNHVMNITDVGHLVSDADDGEDKMMVAMKREGKKSHEIAAFYTKAFLADCDALNIKRPNTICRATDHIPEMIALIQQLEKRGMIYIAGGNVYYDVEKFPEYGKLAKLDLAQLKAGARIDVDQNKKSPFDFVLWFTKSKFENQELQWESPWGRGYPGWHIECSAMAMKYLGDSIDIHCGGIDHVPVHHTNEIAQSEGATGKKWVNVWMHSEFILLNKEKMSKSKGGFLVLENLIEQGFDPMDYRFLCLSAHYRSQLNFGTEALEGARASRNSLKQRIQRLAEQVSASLIAPLPIESEYLLEFRSAFSQDLNTPQALAAIRKVIEDDSIPAEKRVGAALTADLILGLNIQSWIAQDDIPPEILALAQQRIDARNAKNWGMSDQLRDKIAELGFLVEDGKDGQKVRRK